MITLAIRQVKGRGRSKQLTNAIDRAKLFQLAQPG
jgi:hypothetical protein